MHIITHFLISWDLASINHKLEKGDILLVSLVGISPDIDGIGAPIEIITRDWENPFLWFSEFHHKMHSLTFSIILTVVVFFLSKRKITTSLLSFLVFHIHLLCDILGARGPDDYQWPIPYLFPFSDKVLFQWEGQWALNAWQNIAITVIFLFFAFYLAYKKGYSPLVFISKKFDKEVVETIRRRVKSYKSNIYWGTKI